jgi:acid phosphatase
MRTSRTVGIAGVAFAVVAAMGPGTASARSAPESLASTPTVGSAVAASTPVAATTAGQTQTHSKSRVLGYKNMVVIYQENHSFDNLYGRWGRVGGQRVDGLRQADAAHKTQVAQDGRAYSCLPQVDVNLTSPPLATGCSDPARDINSAFPNKPFTIDDYIVPSDKTCPKPGVSPPNGVPKESGLGDPGGCTRDLVHRFYQEKYQINGGHQNRYVTGSDAVGLTMGTYNTKKLPIYKFLHSADAPHYVIADRFFQGANGGSFLNHQWLIAGRAPVVSPSGTVPNPTLRAVNSVVDANGMPTSYPRYTATGPVIDKQLTAMCTDSTNVENYRKACGNFAVNTVQPASPPYSASGAFIPLIDDAKYPNIGDRLTKKGISWAWYSGGWNDAVAGNPGPLFQYHHQPFNYFADYAPGKPGRHHLQDENDFLNAASIGNLPRVSFVKPYGAENEHPGYASASSGSSHLVELIKAVLDGPQARDTLVIVTYDEFGGQWDHVSPPGTGSTPGPHDAFGPGTRIPALLLSARMTSSGVDHTSYDTTSIIATLEHSFHLAPVGIRDTRVCDLRKAVRVGQHR